MKNQILAALSVSFLLMIGSSPAVFANDVDPREMAVDLAVGGMEEGSRPFLPESGEGKVPGSGLSPTMDTRVTASAAGASASAVSSVTDTGTPGSGSAGQQEPVSELPAGAGDSSTVDVNADANLGGGGPGVDADAGATVGANLDNTTSGLEGDTTLGTGPSGGGVSEPASTESGDRSIIEADATVDTTNGSPTVEADASIDTSAEGGLIDANTATSADVVDQELTSDSGLQVDLGENTTLAESSLGNEIGTSTSPATAEADAGLEADVEGTGSGDDVAADPADGLSSTTVL